MIQGLRTVTYPVADLARATAWFTDVFGCAPYFEAPFYVGFAVGGFELGLVPDGAPSTGGAVVFWGVDDVGAEVARIVALGATVHEDVKEVGGGIQVATLHDPFGNALGLIQNPHFDRAAVR